MSLFRFGFKRIRVEEPQPEAIVATTSENVSTQPTTENVEAAESDNDNDSTESSEPKRKKKCKKKLSRKYHEDYLKYGFVSVGQKDEPLPFCVVCHKTLSNHAMKPSNLVRHLSKHHFELKNKPIEYFERLKQGLKDQRGDINAFTQMEPAAIRSSFLVALRIAKAKKPFRIATTLIKPTLLDVTREMFGDAFIPAINAIPLSDNTIRRRIDSMAADIEEQLCIEIKNSGLFALQFDESTDVADEAILIGFVRYVKESKITEDIFCFCSLPEHTTGEQMFNAIDEKMTKYELLWENVVGVCTDGAPAMVGSKRGLTTRIANVAGENYMSTHCVIHREALAAKDMSTELNQTLKEAVRIVNSIKANPLCCRIFTLLCTEMSSDHVNLLLHSEIRWLSRGRVLLRLYELLDEIQIFSIQNRKTHGEFLKFVNDDQWKVKLAYLADIFSLLNGLNLQIQGASMHIFAYLNKIDAFKNKFAMWKNQILAKNFEMFQLTSEMVSTNESLADYIAPIIRSHLEKLIFAFNEQFSVDKDPRKNNLWIVNPFLNADEPNNLTSIETSELIGNFF